ncbi:MAG: hypothetical protein Q7S92_05015 [Candidatus Diapherotrites archaeon]|nr:hypothetical protein [Candidatus Diapherotrites archaeon]
MPIPSKRIQILLATPDSKLSEFELKVKKAQLDALTRLAEHRIHKRPFFQGKSLADFSVMHTPEFEKDSLLFFSAQIAMVHAMHWYSDNGKKLLTMDHFRDLFAFAAHAYHPALVEVFPRRFLRYAEENNLKVLPLKRLQIMAARGLTRELSGLLAHAAGLNPRDVLFRFTGFPSIIHSPGTRKSRVKLKPRINLRKKPKPK